MGCRVLVEVQEGRLNIRLFTGGMHHEMAIK